MEHKMRSTERVAVDSGTHAGNHVPVGDLRSIVRCDYSVLCMSTGVYKLQIDSR